MKRIISLLACTTEMVCVLDRADWLVGRSHECDFPQQILHLPVVTRANVGTGTSSEIHEELRQRQVNGLSLYDVEDELLRELKPELLLTQNQCKVCAVTPEDVLRGAQDMVGSDDLEIFAVCPFSLDDVWQEFQSVAKLVNAEAKAAELLGQWKNRLANLPALSSPPKMVILEWLEPLMGCGYWSPELVTAAGCEEPLGKAGEHAPWIKLEELVAAAPDILVLAPCGLKLEEVVAEAKRLNIFEAWRDIPAVANGRVYAVDGNAYLSRSGPRLVDSAEILSAIAQGETEGEGWEGLSPS